MLYSVRKIWNPDIFQGHGKRSIYFEGWYYKLIDLSGKNGVAVIPGMFSSTDTQHSCAFIQILDHAGESTFHRFPIEQFWASKKNFEIRIGRNIFQKDFVELNITSGKSSVDGSIRMANLTPWPVTLTSPGCMGWYAFAPFMECYHGISSLDHTIEGLLNINGKSMDFTGGRGYIEKDWGRSFPASYIWMQSNHFGKPEVSFTASIAVVPWLNGSFPGFIIGFLCDGTLYRFTTYTKAFLENLKIADNKISLDVIGREHALRINAEKGNSGLIYGPLGNKMKPKIQQSLTGKISIDFYGKTRTRKKLIYSGAGDNAGVEMYGDLSEIIST